MNRLRRGVAAAASAAAASALARADAPSPPPPPASRAPSVSSSSSSVAGALAGERALNGPSILALLQSPHGLLSRLGLLDGHFIYASLRAAPAALEPYDLLLAPDGRSLRCLAVLGARACGHPSIVHGGALAALLDDAFGTLFLHCGAGAGFTANLSVDYVRPVPAGARLEIAVRVVRSEPSKSGRSDKVHMEATVSERRADAEGSAPGAVFARSTALFVAKRTLLPDVTRTVTSGLWRMLA
jgi:acyl-coenzyme A thioesterase PaaI-like protein